MINIGILLILKPISQVFCQLRLDFNFEACNTYLKKFGTENPKGYGGGPTLLAYTGDAVLVENKRKSMFNDFLFDNATYFGFTQDDGKTANDLLLFYHLIFMKQPLAIFGLIVMYNLQLNYNFVQIHPAKIIQFQIYI